MEGSWLRGAEVDRLSLEEAREIAETSVDSAAKEKLVSVEEAALIKSEIEAYFRKELLKVRTKQELLQDARGKFQEAILNFYEKHVGVERTAEAQCAESRTRSTGRTGRRPQGVVHEKIVAEPDPCCSVPEPTRSGNGQDRKPLS